MWRLINTVDSHKKNLYCKNGNASSFCKKATVCVYCLLGTPMKCEGNVIKYFQWIDVHLQPGSIAFTWRFSPGLCAFNLSEKVS